jgi:hypothetical protein
MGVDNGQHTPPMGRRREQHMKPPTPLQSARTRRLFADNYGVAFAGMYFGVRTAHLVRARNADSDELRRVSVSAARDAHRNYLRCLRDAYREAALPVPRLSVRQAGGVA